MSTTLETITKQVMHLPPHQRIVLVGFLLELDSTSEDAMGEQAWVDEIEARIREVDSGHVVGIPYAEVMRQTESRLAP